MALYKKLVLWSISDGLDKMMDYCYNGNVKNSPFWDHYRDQINELCNAATNVSLYGSHLFYHPVSGAVRSV